MSDVAPTADDLALAREPTRLDKFIYYAEQSKRFRRLAVPKQKLSVALLLVGSWAAMVVCLQMERYALSAVPLAVFLSIGFWTCWYGFKWTYWDGRYRDLWLELFMEIPSELEQRGRTLYGYDYDADISIAECFECHFPGDCPICGAE